MKIIHLVLGKANPERMNGVNKVAYQLALTQKKLGHDASVWGIANSLTINFPERNFETKIFQQYKNKTKLDVHLYTAIKQLPTAVIFHIHGAFIPEFYKITRLLQKQSVPYIYTPHGSLTKMAMHKNNAFKKFYFRLFESKLIANAKKVQLLGIHEYNDLDKLTSNAKKCLIANGQNLEDIPDFTNQIPKNKIPVFGFCGRLATFHKGLDLMLSGFAQYLEKGNKGTLALIGDGKDRQELEALVRKLNIQEHVVFHGKKFGQEKFELLNKMDIFLHTSRMEGFPTAVLEAAAMKKVTITSEATNINPFVTKYSSGFILEKNTPEEIADVMEVANVYFKENKLSILGKKNREMVEIEFNWESIAKKLIKVYAA